MIASRIASSDRGVARRLEDLFHSELTRLNGAPAGMMTKMLVNNFVIGEIMAASGADETSAAVSLADDESGLTPVAKAIHGLIVNLTRAVSSAGSAVFELAEAIAERASSLPSRSASQPLSDRPDYGERGASVPRGSK
jgi:hypothetical protein